MSGTWRETERRLVTALRYMGIATGDVCGEPYVILDVRDDNDEPVGRRRIFNVTSLARALEFIK
jgi:hypothetical protein